MSIDANLARLIDRAAPYWAGEAEVVRTYWSSPVRSRETDRLWLARQCFKEFWGSGVSKMDRGGVVLGAMKNILARAADIDVTIDRYELLDWIEGIKAEFSHYCAFADCYDALRPEGAPKLNPAQLGSWPEEDALTQLRFRHQDEHGALGMRACKFTEGGYCALFAEGKALADAAVSTRRSLPPAASSMRTRSITCWRASPASPMKGSAPTIGGSWASSSSRRCNSASTCVMRSSAGR